VTRILFAGGGTAGHIEPALATARQWRSTHPQDRIDFLGVSAGLETRIIPDAGFSLLLITKVRIARSLSPSLLLAPFTLIKSIAQCLNHLRGVDLLVGFGGYVSAPAYIAAALSRVPIVIHEANAKPGIANRLGAIFTKNTALSYPVTTGSLAHSLIVGLPLRENIALAFSRAEKNWAGARAEAKSALGFSAQQPLIFVFGGSQGSVAINKVITQSKGELAARGIQILHGAGGSAELSSSDENYQVHPYISDMATAYLAADLIISRSGAVTCAEVSTLGKYALFIPLPVGNGEQRLNAAELVSDSRAEICEQREFTPTWLAANIERLLEKSAQQQGSGSDKDMQATAKIAALMEFVLLGGK
jgi:UDP-N-acetylglucosamine--N-acetylmuramyl-(pentapeptide) pyrophosphoryl-undecaprenol N-acetylglucosamine transferase